MEINISGAQLLDYLKTTLQVQGELDENTKLFSTGELDSVSMMDLITFVENKAKIEVRFEDVTLENFDSVAAILRYIISRK